MTAPQKENETYSEEETVARREAALKRMLATPHKPHKTEARIGTPYRDGEPLKSPTQATASPDRRIRSKRMFQLSE